MLHKVDFNHKIIKIGFVEPKPRSVDFLNLKEECFFIFKFY